MSFVVFFAVTDLTLAIFPVTFLWKLQMNRRTKIAIGVVLSLGVVSVTVIAEPSKFVN